MAWGRGFRARFILQRQLPRLATAGIPVFYRVTVGNPGAKAQNGLVLLEDLEDTRPSFEEFVAHWQAERRNLTSFSLKWFSARRPASMARVRSAALPDLPAGGETEALVELLPRRRGVLRFTGATLARPDPLGLFRAFSSMAAPQSLLVLPRRYPLPPIALPGTARHQQGGVALASSVGQSEEFVSLRDYRRGDPIRHIHWRSWAHANKPIVKEFQDEFFVRHALVLDTCGARRGGRAFEEAVSVAASFACSIQTQESLLDLLFVGPQAYCFTAGRGLAPHRPDARNPGRRRAVRPPGPGGSPAACAGAQRGAQRVRLHPAGLGRAPPNARQPPAGLGHPAAGAGRGGAGGRRAG